MKKQYNTKVIPAVDMDAVSFSKTQEPQIQKGQLIAHSPAHKCLLLYLNAPITVFGNQKPVYLGQKLLQAPSWWKKMN